MWGTKSKASAKPYSHTFSFLVDWIVGQGLAVAFVGMVTAALILWVDLQGFYNTLALRSAFFDTMILGLAPLAIITASAYLQQNAIKQLIGVRLEGWVRDTVIAGCVSVLWFAFRYTNTDVFAGDSLRTMQLIIPTVLFIVAVQGRRLLMTVPEYGHDRVWLWMIVTFVGSCVVFYNLPSLQSGLFIQLLCGQMALQALITLAAFRPIQR